MGNDFVPFFSCSDSPAVYNASHKVFANIHFLRAASWPSTLVQPKASSIQESKRFLLVFGKCQLELGAFPFGERAVWSEDLSAGSFSFLQL